MVSIPPLGYGAGTAWFNGYKHNVDDTPVVTALIEQTTKALELGCRHLDLAEMYGNDREAGLALKSFLDSTSEVKREDIWITSKLLVNMNNPVKGCAEIIDRVGCQYLDLLLLHAPLEFRAKDDPTFTADISTVWSQMESLVESGQVRNIGVSNFRVSDLQELLAISRIRPFINQVEFNPYLQQPELQQFCITEKILLAAFSPLGTLNLWPGGPADSVIEGIAAVYRVSTSIVLLRYTQQKGYIPITTSSKTERIQEYWSSLPSLSTSVPAFSLTEGEIERIDAAGRQQFKRKYWAPHFADASA